MKMIYLALISILFAACTRTPAVIEPPISYCYDWGGKYVAPSGNMNAYSLPDCPLDIECPEAHPQKMDFYSPCFNPNNANQIAFVQYSLHTNSQPVATLCTFDMCTGEKKVLYAPCWSTPDWSIRDWIIFSGANNQVFKVKPNGDSLTQLTFEGSFNNHPTWNPIGNKFIFYRSYGGTKRYLFISESNGSIIDTIGDLYYYSHGFKWITDSTLSIIYAGNPNNVYTFNLITNNKTLIKYNHSTRNYESIINTIWQPYTQSVIWLKMHQIGKTNINDKIDWSLRYGADNRRYMDIDISPDEKTLIVERQDTYTIDSVTRYVSSNLYLMDMKGMQERKILIPDTP